MVFPRRVSLGPRAGVLAHTPVPSTGLPSPSFTPDLSAPHTLSQGPGLPLLLPPSYTPRGARAHGLVAWRPGTLARAWPSPWLGAGAASSLLAPWWALLSPSLHRWAKNCPTQLPPLAAVPAYPRDSASPPCAQCPRPHLLPPTLSWACHACPGVSCGPGGPGPLGRLVSGLWLSICSRLQEAVGCFA